MMDDYEKLTRSKAKMNEYESIPEVWQRTPASASQTQSEQECDKCCKNRTPQDIIRLPCGHRICLKCVEELATTASAPGGKKYYYLKCPSWNCDVHFAISRTPDSRCESSPKITQQCIVDRYADVVRSAKVIPKPKGGKQVCRGLAVLKDNLFVASGSEFLYKHTVTPRADDSVEIGAPPTQVPIAGLKYPRGVATSERFSTIYIVDWTKTNGGALRTYRDKTGTVTSVEFDLQPFGVSAAAANDDDVVEIYVTCATPIIGNKTVFVYRDNGEKLVFGEKWELPGDVVGMPRHAVRMPPLSAEDDKDDDLLAVCHGWTRLQKNRVSIVRRTAPGGTAAAGVCKEVLAYGTAAGSDLQQLHQPMSLCLDEDNNILVADYYNHRVQLLTSRLQLVRHLVTKEEHGIEYPRQVCLDGGRGLLFIGLEDGRVCIFRVLDTKKSTD